MKGLLPPPPPEAFAGDAIASLRLQSAEDAERDRAQYLARLEQRIERHDTRRKVWCNELHGAAEEADREKRRMRASPSEDDGDDADMDEKGEREGSGTGEKRGLLNSSVYDDDQYSSDDDVGNDDEHTDGSVAAADGDDQSDDGVTELEVQDSKTGCQWCQACVLQ